MWNADYMQFLIERVWRIERPVDIVDFGCGRGFLGGLMLPLLPEGSSYTGIDNGGLLLKEAREIFAGSPYKTDFMKADLLEYEPVRKYDMAVCQAVLMHIPRAIGVLKKMRDSVIPGGKVVCVEISRDIANSAMYFHGVDYSNMLNLGILQKLWLNDLKRDGTDYNIGLKIPVYMAEIGLKDIGVRQNDCVNFVHPEAENYAERRESFAAGGWDDPIGARESFVEALMKRGLTMEEAVYQYEAEGILRGYVRDNSDTTRIVSASGLVISFGTV